MARSGADLSTVGQPGRPTRKPGKGLAARPDELPGPTAPWQVHFTTAGRFAEAERPSPLVPSATTGRQGTSNPIARKPSRNASTRKMPPPVPPRNSESSDESRANGQTAIFEPHQAPRPSLSADRRTDTSQVDDSTRIILSRQGSALRPITVRLRSNTRAPAVGYLRHKLLAAI